jgi:uncharacterized protein (TIGR02001 family)
MVGFQAARSAAGLGAAVAALVMATAASAQNFGDMFDIAFGAAVTNDYISRGISQTNGDAAIQGYVELDYGKAYVGAWASNVNFGTPDTEIDASVGFRPETDNAAFDLGYVQYIYASNTSPSYGELYALAEYYATDSLTLGGNVYFAPDYSQGGASATYVEANVDYTLFGNVGASGGVGYQAFASKLGLPDYTTWNAGVYWSWNDTVTVDLRYTDSNLSKGQCFNLMSRGACGPRFMATLSFDTSVSSLTGAN